jgi:hypothetical protein
MEYSDVKDLLYLGIGIFLIALSAYFMQKGHDSTPKDKTEKS